MNDIDTFLEKESILNAKLQKVFQLAKTEMIYIDKMTNSMANGDLSEASIYRMKADRAGQALCALLD